ncbi:MAG: alkyl hydroperoxide reductase [Ponticaulis sp.]|nr:alkyl hydroperoxide reductase [Ponticaulis sp.]
MIRTLLAATALTLAAPLALADHHEEDAEMMMIGPHVGHMAPDFSAVLAASGDAVTLADLAGEEGTVLVFSRSLDWCPFCKKQSIDLKDAAAPLAEKGWSLNLITYDAPETLADYADQQSIPYTLLSDTNSAMIDAFGLRNHEMNGKGRYAGIPHPAIIFIGTDGEIKAMLREEGYKDRPPVETVLEKADELNAADMG